MKTNFTLGPWHKGAGNGTGSIFAGTGRMRCESGGTVLYPIATIMTGFNEIEDEANADLIATAPKLYTALEMLMHFANDEKKCRRGWGGLEHTALINAAKDALSEARGE